MLPPHLNPFGLEPLEVACGLVFGLVEGPRLEPTRVSTPLAALEAAVRPALERTPCLVSFSGGNDSSAVLAVATAVARRDGLPLPIPATNVFPKAPASDEREWQERIVSHLDLEDWVRIELTDELDALGPIATRALRQHGLLSPFNAHFHVPLLEVAASGSLLTGIGGDEMFGEGRWARAAAIMAGRARPELRDVLRVCLALAPSAVGAAVLRRREGIPFGWLRREARKEATARMAAQGASQPVRFGARLAWSRRLRYLDVGLKSLDLLAADLRVGIVHPLVDLDFLSALARAGGFAGFATRSHALQAVLEDLLPAELYSRSTKVHFDEVFCNRYSQAFVDAWDGNGVDRGVVDVEAVHRLWRDGAADSHALALLQAAWLARDSEQESTADRSDEMVGGLAD